VLTRGILPIAGKVARYFFHYFHFLFLHVSNPFDYGSLVNVKIQSGPVPPRYKNWMRDTLKKMRNGQFFEVADDSARKSALRVAKDAKIKVTTRKQNGKGYRIWRTE